MKVEKMPVKYNGSCNFCSTVVYDNCRRGLQYPYDHPYLICGPPELVRVCEDCLNEIKEIK